MPVTVNAGDRSAELGQISGSHAVYSVQWYCFDIKIRTDAAKYANMKISRIEVKQRFRYKSVLFIKH